MWIGNYSLELNWFGECLMQLSNLTFKKKINMAKSIVDSRTIWNFPLYKYDWVLWVRTSGPIDHFRNASNQSAQDWPMVRKIKDQFLQELRARIMDFVFVNWLKQ